MSELFHEYETTVIIRPDLDDADTVGILERLESVITTEGGHLLLRDDWGKKKMAYIIQNHQKGHYTLLSHLSPASLVTELERNIRNEDRVIRFMTVLMDRDVDVSNRLEQAAEVRKQREAEAKARAEEEARRAAEAEAHGFDPNQDPMAEQTAAFNQSAPADNDAGSSDDTDSDE